MSTRMRADWFLLPQECSARHSMHFSFHLLRLFDYQSLRCYGSLYCLQVDRIAMVLHSYRFYRNAIVQKGSLPIYSSKVAVSMVDNVLLVHQVDAKAISASSSEVPSVLKFLQRRKLEANKAKQLCLAITQTVILERRPVTMVAKAMDVLVTSYSHSLKTGSYFKGIKTERIPSSVPNVSGPGQGMNVFTSRTDGLGKSIQHKSASRVNSIPISRSSTYSSSGTEDNSSIEPLKISSIDAQLVAGKVDMGAESCTTEVQPSSIPSQLPGPCNNPLNASVSEQQKSQLSSPAISPDEMYKFVFAPIEEEMGGEPSYLVAIILEFFQSANLEKVKVYPNLYALTIQLLARSEQYAELGLFIINKIIEPSKQVALQLLESGRQNFQIRKLGSDMLRQLSLHYDYVLLLVQDEHYLEALRYARKHKVTTIRPSLFLEAAFTSNDSQHLAAVLRFFSDFIPGFQSTSDFFAYHHILNKLKLFNSCLRSNKKMTAVYLPVIIIGQVMC